MIQLKNLPYLVTMLLLMSSMSFFQSCDDDGTDSSFYIVVCCTDNCTKTFSECNEADAYMVKEHGGHLAFIEDSNGSILNGCGGGQSGAPATDSEFIHMAAQGDTSVACINARQSGNTCN
jgi:hypothetical protein